MFDDRSPIYRQIADRLRADILTGALEPDEQVMSTTRYAAFHRINPATVARAFADLVDEGLIYKRRGVGMFVAPDAPERLRQMRRAAFSADVLAPMLAEAERLGLGRDEVIDAIRAHPVTPTTRGGDAR